MRSQNKNLEGVPHARVFRLHKNTASSNPVPQHPLFYVYETSVTPHRNHSSISLPLKNTDLDKLKDIVLTSDRFGFRKGGTASLIPRKEATKSGTSFPSENLPLGMCFVYFRLQFVNLLSCNMLVIWSTL